MVKAHGLRGEVVVSLVSDYPEVRLAPGSRLWAGDRELVVRVGAAAPGSLARAVRGRRRPDGRGGDWPDARSTAEALDDPEALWVHELIGSPVVEEGTGVERGRVVSVVANPAHELLELDSGALVPIVFVRSCEDGVTVVAVPEGLFEAPAAEPSDGAEPVRIDVFTIFPDLVDGFCRQSLLGRAREAGLLDLRCHDLRDHTTDVHRTVDDTPFGGGAGMVLRPEPVFAVRRGGRSAPPAVPPRARGAALRPGHGPRPGRGRRVQPAVRAATRASTTGSGSTWSTASCRSATTCWPAARWRPAS